MCMSRLSIVAVLGVAWASPSQDCWRWHDCNSGGARTAEITPEEILSGNAMLQRTTSRTKKPSPSKTARVVEEELDEEVEPVPNAKGVPHEHVEASLTKADVRFNASFAKPHEVPEAVSNKTEQRDEAPPAKLDEKAEDPFIIKSFQATLGRYPGYGGGLHVHGDVQATQHSESIGVSWTLNGADARCSHTGRGQGSCGIRIHEGRSCSEDSLVGDHLGVPDFSDKSVWQQSIYTTRQEGNKMTVDNVMGNVMIHAKLGDIAEHVVVVHDFRGIRVACGVLVESSVPAKSKASCDVWRYRAVLSAVLFGWIIAGMNTVGATP